MLIRLLGAQWLAIGFNGVISFSLSVFVARTLGPEVFGAYTLAVSVGALFGIVIDGGFGKVLLREAVQPTKGGLFGATELPSYAVGYAFMVTAGLFTSVLLVPHSFHRLTFVAIVLTFGTAVLSQFSMSILRGQGRLMRDALWQIVSRFLTATFMMVTLIAGGREPWEILSAQCAGTLFLLVILSKNQLIIPKFVVPLSVLRMTMPLLWLDLATVVYFRADMVLLRLLDIPKIEIGYYGVAYRVIESFLLLASPVGLLLFRRFRLGGRGNEQSLSLILKPAAIAGLVGLSIFAGSMLFGEYFIALAFGAMYRPAGQYLEVLSLFLAFALANGVLSQGALAFGLERVCMVAATVAAFVNIMANVCLIPTYGVMASAWTTVLTELMLGLCILIGLFVKLKNINTGSGSLK